MKIEIYKDKWYLTSEHEPDSPYYEKKEIDSIYSNLEYVVEIKDNNFTLNDLFTFVEKEVDILQLVFNNILGGFSLQKFIDEIKKEPVDNDKEIDYLEIYWGATLTEYENEKESEIYAGIHGIAEKEHTPYSIVFSKLNEIKHCPIKLNTDFVFYKEKIYPLNDLSIEKIDMGKRSYTLYEFLKSVFFEISYNGEPEERDGQCKELLEKVDDIKENVNTKTFDSIDELIKETEN